MPGAADSPLPVGQSAIDPAAMKAARDYAARHQSEGFVVWHDGAIRDATYWQGFDRNKLIASKSMAKMIVGMVIGRAVAQGHIESIDQPVSDFVTEWKGTPKEGPTIRQFLQNSSGISRFSYNDFKPWSQTMREYLSEHHERILIDETTKDYEPGTEYDYSMITSDVLAIVIERATKQRYGDYVGTSPAPADRCARGDRVRQPPRRPRACRLLHDAARRKLRSPRRPADRRRRLAGCTRILPEGWVKDTITPSPANRNWGLHMWIGDPHVERRRFFP